MPHGTQAGELDFDGLFSSGDQKRNARFILYALAASDEALKDSGLNVLSEEQAQRFGVSISQALAGYPPLSKRLSP